MDKREKHLLDQACQEEWIALKLHYQIVKT